MYILITGLLRALYGSALWRILNRKYKFNSTESVFVLLNAEENAAVNRAFLKYRKKYIDKNSITKCYIITNRRDLKNSFETTDHIISISYFSLMCLFKLYSLSDFPANVVFLDFIHIDGRDGMALNGIRDINEDILVKKALLNL